MTDEISKYTRCISGKCSLNESCYYFNAPPIKGWAISSDFAGLESIYSGEPCRFYLSLEEGYRAFREDSGDNQS